MKHNLTLFFAMLICMLASCAAQRADGGQEELTQARNEARMAITEAQYNAEKALREDPGSTLLDTQQEGAREALDAATYEQLVRDLNLTSKQRKKFESLYKAYRRDLDAAIDKSVQADISKMSDAEMQRNIKGKLDNISATARVKRTYVDKFATVLTADQIRRLYNTEGQIGVMVKKISKNLSDNSRTDKSKLRGSGRLITRDFGRVGAYTSLRVSHCIKVTLSPTARTVSITADDNVMDYLAVDQSDGELSLYVKASSTSDLHISAIVPASAGLAKIAASSYGSVESAQRLSGRRLDVQLSSYGRLKADIDADNVSLSIQSYGKHIGHIRGKECTLKIASYGAEEGDIDADNVTLSIQSYGRHTGYIRGKECTLTSASYGGGEGDIDVDKLTLSTSSYGHFSGDISARSSSISIFSYGSVKAAVSGTELSLSCSSRGKYAGDIDIASGKLSVSSRGSITARMKASDMIKAQLTSGGIIRLSGSATVTQASVNVSAESEFSAPSLRVDKYDVNATSGGKADICCTGTLTTLTASGGAIEYSGNCRLIRSTPNVRRK